MDLGILHATFSRQVFLVFLSVKGTGGVSFSFVFFCMETEEKDLTDVTRKLARDVLCAFYLLNELSNKRQADNA